MNRLAQWIVDEGDRDPDRIRDRVRTPPSFIEWIVIVSIGVILFASTGYTGHGIDWEIFSGAADGEFTSEFGLGYYYAYWLLPVFDIYALAGVGIGGLLWSFSNVAGVWFAARVFGARPAVVLAGFGALSGFYTGTITGVALAAIAGLYWAAHEGRWTLVGALSLLAVAKPQWGLPLTAIIVIHERPPVLAWIRMALVPVPVVLMSLAAFGWWPADILRRATENPPEGNGSLWFFVGPAVLLLWVPLLLPMTTRRRMALVGAVSVMAVPYVQQYDFVVLWVLATDGLGLISHLDGLLIGLVGSEGARGFQVLMPLASYILLVAAPVQARFRRFRPAAAGGGAAEQPA